jgi:hypothetical protein
MSPNEQIRSRSKGSADAYPGFIEPALATTKDAPPSGAQWLHELKLDGYRIQAHIWSDEVKLFTRSGLDWTARIGRPLVGALRSLGVHDAVIDGELVVRNVPALGQHQIWNAADCEVALQPATRRCCHGQSFVLGSFSRRLRATSRFFTVISMNSRRQRVIWGRGRENPGVGSKSGPLAGGEALEPSGMPPEFPGFSGASVGF